MVVVSSCDTLPDQSLFLNSSCNAPCWNGIIPGTTRVEQLDDIIDEIDSIQSGTLSRLEEPYLGFDDIVFVELEDGIEAEIYLFEDRVSRIQFTGFLGVTLDNIVTRHGEPDSVLVTQSICSKGLISEGLCPVAYLIFREAGILIIVGSEGSTNTHDLNITPAIEVSFLEYFFPEDFDLIVENGGFATSGLVGEEPREHMQPWLGYGGYSGLDP